MEKGHNIYAGNIRRLVDVHPDAEQITFLDTRFYKRKPEVYYPSVTYVLSYFPKGRFFEDWLKQVGSNAEYIAQKSADEGTQVHNAIEQMIEGKQIDWVDSNGNIKYNLEVWGMILKFVDFWNTYKPKIVASELHIFSDTHKIAGTVDAVVEMNGELWIIDFKTSNSLHTSYELQLSAYAQCWNESFDRKIDKTGILWLKSSKRGPDKQQKSIQGKGWELKTYSRHYDDAFKLFEHVYAMFKEENPDFEPASNKYPTSVKLEL